MKSMKIMQTMERIIVCLVIAAATMPLLAERIIYMDAAQVDRDGNALADPHVRLVVDNQTELTDLTGVRLRVEIHSGEVASIRRVFADDAANPWLGDQVDTAQSVIEDILYTPTFGIYLNNGFEIAPSLECEYLPSHPNYKPFDPNTVEPKPEGYPGTDEDWLAFNAESWHINNNKWLEQDRILAGMKLDLVVRFEGLFGPVDLFSTATAELRTDQGNYILTDADEGPQSVPGVQVSAMLAVGGTMTVLRRRRAG